MFSRGEEGLVAIIEKPVYSIECDICVKKQLHSAVVLNHYWLNEARARITVVGRVVHCECI
jgi:hypothetical protein